MDSFIKDRRNRHLKLNIERRFPDYGTDRDENCYANFLDPVLKGLHLKAVNKYDRTSDNLENLEEIPEIESERINNEQNIIPEEAKSLTPRELLRKKILDKEAGRTGRSGVFSPVQVSRFRREVATYEAMPDADSTTDRLMWWKSHSETFPILSKLASKILCIPAASSKSERTFSVGGNTVTPKRGRLSPLTVQALVTISCNLRLLKEMEHQDQAIKDIVEHALNLSGEGIEEMDLTDT